MGSCNLSVHCLFTFAQFILWLSIACTKWCSHESSWEICLLVCACRVAFETENLFIWEQVEGGDPDSPLTFELVMIVSIAELFPIIGVGGCWDLYTFVVLSECRLWWWTYNCSSYRVFNTWRTDSHNLSSKFKQIYLKIGGLVVLYLFAEFNWLPFFEELSYL